MYQYDALNRMIQASSSSGWSEQYGYDGFGNLYSKTGNGSAPLSATVDQTSNCIRMTGITCDANGNQIYNGIVYDAENRLVTPPGAPTTVYAYDAQNKRFFTWPGTYDPVGDGNPSGYRVSLYSPAGQRLGTYEIDVINIGSNFPNLTLQTTLTSSDIYFGSRRVGARAVQDRLGSVGSYYPYGEARGTPPPSDTWSFATYWRDPSNAGPGLDYADQRYYSSQYGRFMTPDPYRATATSPSDPANPQSWNRYAYVQGDPINATDPSGLARCAGCPNAQGNPIDFSPDLAPLTGPYDIWFDASNSGSGGWYGAVGDQLVGGSHGNAKGLSSRGLDCIKSYEGLSLTVYQDVAGNDTIGYGHLITAGEDFSAGINEQQAADLLRQDAGWAISAVQDLVKVAVSQDQFDALVSFVFNVGKANFAKSSLLSNLNSGRTVTEANFTDWNKAGGKVVDGLTNRCEDEYSLFSNGKSTRCPK